jgi:pSer/pThr/pTyr-binding forkhead associated (FHA) protein
MLPDLNIEVLKDGEVAEKFKLQNKSYYIFGQLKTNDVFCAHPTISRKHACIIIDKDQNVSLVDLGSKSGTLLNE